MKKLVLFICLFVFLNSYSQVAAYVSISGPNILCEGALGTYTPFILNGGTSPAFEWKINGVLVSTDSTYSSDSLKTNDTIICIMTSSLPGALNNPDTSNFIYLTVLPNDSATISYPFTRYCKAGTDPSVTITGKLGGTFFASPAGLSINATTGLIDLDSSLSRNYTIYYITGGTCPAFPSFNITIVDSAYADFTYSDTAFCIGGPNPLAITYPWSVSGVFSSNDTALILLDSLTGEIDLINSALGTYTITNTLAATGGGCLADTSSRSIRIKAGNDYATFTYPGNPWLTYPKSANTAYAQITGTQGGFFHATPVGLSIDSLSGDIYPSQSDTGVYTVTYTTYGVCPGSSTKTITIIDSITGKFAYPKNICAGVANSLLMPLYAPLPPINNSFSAMPLDSFGILQIDMLTGGLNLVTAKPGRYYITNSSFSLFGGKTYSDTVVIYDCVWPGDANKDKEAGVNDLLSIGLYYSDAGLPRDTVNNTWAGFVCDDWGSQIKNGADKKNTDCNGDGIIDFNDTTAIVSNINSSHFISPYNPSGDERAVDPGLYFVTQNNVYYPGDWVTAELWAGSASLSVSNFYGLAFIFQYPIHLIQTGTLSFNFDSINWTGTNGVDALQISYNEVGNNGRVHGAISRINHTNANGFGKIAELTFQIDTGIDSLESLYLFFQDYIANDSIGDTIKFSPVSKSLGITPLTSIIESIHSSIITSVYPNPFTQQTTISFNKVLNQASVKIMDVLGKEVKSVSFSGQQFVLERGELSDGIYFLNIKDDNNYYHIHKIVLQSK